MDAIIKAFEQWVKTLVAEQVTQYMTENPPEAASEDEIRDWAREEAESVCDDLTITR